MPAPCAADPAAFTAEHFTPAEAERLAQAYCDRCPLRPECYRSAIRDPLATGMYGGVPFRHGVPARHPDKATHWQAK